MFLELIATFAAGFAAFGIVMLLNKGLGGRLPRWFAPVAAGCAMLAATISSEYSWYPRTSGGLPDGMEIADTVEGTAFYRPWTYVRPFIARFVAVDMATLRTHPQKPSQKLGDVYYFGRWSPISKVPVLADCDTGRRAALTDAITFQDDGTVTGADWVTAEANDPILNTMCGGT